MCDTLAQQQDCLVTGPTRLLFKSKASLLCNLHIRAQVSELNSG